MDRLRVEVGLILSRIGAMLRRKVHNLKYESCSPSL